MLQAQISAPGSSTMRLTKYPTTLRMDPVFIFCTDDASDRGTLSATSPGGTAPFTFIWTRYDQVGKAYTIPVKTETGTSSTVTDLVEGGYKVNITDGGSFSIELYAWVSLDKPVAEAKLLNYTCEMVALDGTAAVDPFVYYDPADGKPKSLPNAVAFEWSSTPFSAIPNPKLQIDPITFDPPLTDVEYMLQVTDSFGCSSSSSFDYTSIHVRAAFVVTPTEGEAPLEVSLTDNSIRALNYLWTFGDDSLSALAEPGTHTYYEPDDYIITLTIESELFCSDDTTVTIKVLPSEIKIPNVFSPNGDEYNNFFRPETVSLKYINVQIFAKSGHRVYYYEGKGEDIQNWTGWDGKINNSERSAEPGAYYYIIRAVGYDDIKYEGRLYRGALYLFR